jgi:hypothetical protein
MIPSFLPAFQKYHNEAAIIGRLLAGYTTLEISLLNCTHVIRDDFDTVLKTMFRVRGETQRINIADAFGRHHYHKHKLATQFERAISSMRYCLRIRNQYAHCVWYDDLSGRLSLTNLEDTAKKHKYLSDFGSLPVFYVDIPLLQKQEEFFFYTNGLLCWVNYEGRTRAGKLSIPPRPELAQMALPPLVLPPA